LLDNQNKKGPIVQILACPEPSGQWSKHTLELLGDAWVLSERLGGQTGAWVLGSCDGIDELRHFGCDLVLNVQSPRLESWSSEAVAFALKQTLPNNCRVILLPADAHGEEVAALLSQALRGYWIPDVLIISVTRTGSLEVTAMVHGGKFSRSLRANAEVPFILTMKEGVAEVRKKKGPDFRIETIEIDFFSVPRLTEVKNFMAPDPKTIDITDAPRIVAGGKGTAGEAGMKLVAQLAEKLGASVAASRLAVDLGWAPAERQVGQTGRTVRPRLYVACGISGASHHVAGMRESEHIVAINPDARAPIHDISHLTLAADLHQLIPTICGLLERRAAGDWV